MSFDLSQLVHLGNSGHGQNTQILSVNGTANQSTFESSQGIVTSGGPNAFQRIQVANSNINQTIYNFHFTGKPLNFGAEAIANRDHGACPSRWPTVTSYARPYMIEAADQGDLNSKLAAVKESTVEVRKSTEEIKESMVKLAEAAAKVSGRTTELELHWSFFKLSLDKKAEVAFGDFIFERCTSLVRLGESIVEFGQSGVEHGETIVWDSDSILMTMDGDSISLAEFDALTSKLGEVAAAYRESCARFTVLFTRHARFSPHYDTEEFGGGELGDPEDSRLEQFMKVVGFETFLGMTAELRELIETAQTPLEAFSESIVAYAKSLGAPYYVIATFEHNDSE